MTERTQILLGIAVLLFMGELVYLIKRKELILKYALIWIFLALLFGIGVVVPEFFYAFVAFVGIRYPMNGIFLYVLGALLLILMSLTAIVSRQSLRITRLIQRVAILERSLEEYGEKEKKNEVKRCSDRI